MATETRLPQRCVFLGVTAAALLAAGCAGDVQMSGTNKGTATPGQSGSTSCADPLRCCPAAELVCYGDPDRGSICMCPSLWDCSGNPQKCVQAEQVPGTGDWSCAWDPASYRCTKAGNPDEAPPGGGAGWSCSWDAGTGTWICDKSFPPNPSNTPAGVGAWDCAADDAADKTICTAKGAAPPPEQPAGGGESNCADGIDDDGDGKIDCQDSDCPACAPPTKPPGVVGPGGEVCDGKDNNGDGKIDEGNVCAGVGEPCPPGAYQICDCYCGVHRKCAPDGTWGPCIVDGMDGGPDMCAPAQVTSHQQCPWGTICDFGRCVLAFGISGQCHGHADCPVGQVCDMGECINDDYDPNRCP